MGSGMRRREFITFIGGAAAAWPLAALAQQSGKLPIIGYLSQGTPEDTAAFVAASREGIGSVGLTEGKDYTTELRWARNDVDRLPGLAAELVRAHVTVIVSVDTVLAVRAAKTATAEIPIVFAVGTDPVKDGLVTSLNHPGGNITGGSSMNLDIGGKLIGLLHELLPTAKRIAVLVDPDNPGGARSLITSTQQSALELGLPTEFVFATNEGEIGAALTGLGARAQGLIVQPTILFLQNRRKLSALAIHERMAALSSLPDFVKADGLMGYGSSFVETHRQTGVYVGRILKGERPGELPVQLATKFTFAINLKTARAIGLDIPPTMLARADEVIE
jgi:putative tryptophan/tyrosine transport system substrate-binding protein